MISAYHPQQGWEDNDPVRLAVGGGRADQPGWPDDMLADVLPALDVARVQRWCAARVPEQARHQVRVECDEAPQHLTIIERRAPWPEDSAAEWTRHPIARLHYTSTTTSWSLYWCDRNLRFHPYDRAAPSPTVEELLSEIDRDSVGRGPARHGPWGWRVVRWLLARFGDQPSPR